MLYMDPVTMGEDNKKICKGRPNMFEDPVTKKDIETIVDRALGANIKIINYHVRIFSEEKLGFLGAHRHLVVTIQRQNSIEKEIHSFFMKSIPYDIEEQASVIAESNAFYKETNFYKYIMPELMMEVKDKSWIAQCYLVKDDVLVFENLSSKNYNLKDKLLDATALKSALGGFAKLHAASILAERRLGKTFQDLYPDILQECLFLKKGRFYDWFRTSVDVTAAIAKTLGLNHTCISKTCDQIFDKMKASKTRRNVICHGDPKSLNIMFDDSRPIPKCVLVDFQLARYVPPMVDVAQFLYLNTRRNVRDESTEEVLRHYHEVFCETLRDSHPSIQVPSFSDIIEEFEEMRVVGLVSTSLYSPINFMEGKRCAELTSDSDGFAKLLFEDHTDIVLETMQIDPTYNKILTEIVKEFVERYGRLQ